jgi:hypothetical protein
MVNKKPEKSKSVQSSLKKSIQEARELQYKLTVNGITSLLRTPSKKQVIITHIEAGDMSKQRNPEKIDIGPGGILNIYYTTNALTNQYQRLDHRRDYQINKLNHDILA